MSNLQVKNVPATLHRRLRKFAERQNRTIGEIILEALEHELAREEFRERLARRAAASLPVRAAELLREERAGSAGEPR